MSMSSQRSCPMTATPTDAFPPRSVTCLAGNAYAMLVAVATVTLWLACGTADADTDRDAKDASRNGKTATESTKPISDEDRRFFENKIRPVLVEHCYECHSSTSGELEGGLAVDTRSGLRRGGQSGPAVSPDAPGHSLLLDAIRYDGIEMPPEAPLPEAIVHDFETWIRRGAPDPRTENLEGEKPHAENPNAVVTDDDAPETWWSFLPPIAPAIPTVDSSDWPRDPIDRFVLKEIEAAGIAPTRDAEPEVLLRRLTVDLTGLPPTTA